MLGIVLIEGRRVWGGSPRSFLMTRRREFVLLMAHLLFLLLPATVVFSPTRFCAELIRQLTLLSQGQSRSVALLQSYGLDDMQACRMGMGL